jgi:hypothetical protein
MAHKINPTMKQNLEISEGINSWAFLDNIEIVEKKFINKEVINEKNISVELNIEKINKVEEKNLSLVEIMEIDFTNTSIAKIIEYQTIVSKYLKNYLKQNLILNNDEKNKYIEKLEWLLKGSEYICDKQKLVPINNDKFIRNDKNIYLRSSYKFCKFGFNCKHLIKNNKLINNCNDQHFVHNFICFDIKNILEYMKSNDNYDYNEITKSFNTIYFVYNHMKEECDAIKNNYSNFIEFN